MSMDTLPEDVLIAIFNLLLDKYSGGNERQREKKWRLLVHVCHRWRSIVFGSPRHLNLELVCTGRTHARRALDVWPSLPLVIKNYRYHSINFADDIVVVLERRDRVRRIIFETIQSSILRRILPEMQQPFPELTYMELYMDEGTAPIVPESFLGGSAPLLEHLRFGRIPFPGLPKLLLSTTYLKTLHLYNIPHSGYVSPDAMVTALSTLTSLKELTLSFQSPRSCPDLASRHPPPSTRSVLPVLTIFRFKGASEYLEDFVELIDTPRLNKSLITFFNDFEFETPQFRQFITRTPMLRALLQTHITLLDDVAVVRFFSPTSDMFQPIDLKLGVVISCRGLDWQVSSVEQVCASCFPLISMSEALYIYKDDFPRIVGIDPKSDKIETRLWVELLHPFTAVKNLYLCEKIAQHIGPALQELVDGGTTEVLPTLENIFGRSAEEKGIGQFVAARQVAGHPITTSRWSDLEKDSIPVFRRY